MTALPSAQSRLEATLLHACRDKRLLVLDYDGTLAYLAVDWTSVRRDLSNVAAREGFQSNFRPLFDEIARFRDELGPERLPLLFRPLAHHEEIGVDGQQTRIEVVEAVRAAMQTIGLEAVVFSINLHRTIAAGLAKLGMVEVSAIVGCDDVTRWKPDPAGLRVLLKRAGVTATEALYVGDSPRDAEAAEAAGVEFLRV